MDTFLKININNLLFNSRFVYKQPTKAPSTKVKKGVEKGKPKAEKPPKPAPTEKEKLIQKQFEEIELKKEVQRLKKVLKSQEFMLLMARTNITDRGLQKLYKSLEKADEKEKEQIHKQIGDLDYDF